MPQCEMCGREADLFIVMIEGAQMRVCKEDAKFGKILAMAPKPLSKKEEIKQSKPEKEILEIVVADFSKRIKDSRERLKLSQEELGKKVAEKESVIQHLETNHMRPSLELARKLEKFFKIVLIETVEEVHGASKAAKSDTLTLGDLIKIKQR